MREHDYLMERSHYYRESVTQSRRQQQIIKKLREDAKKLRADNKKLRAQLKDSYRLDLNHTTKAWVFIKNDDL